MAQGPRIEAFEQIEAILDRVREAYDDGPAELPPVEDRVERDRSKFFPDAPSHRVDTSRAFTDNLRNGPFDPDRLRRSQRDASKNVVLVEPRAHEFEGAPGRNAELPEAVAEIGPSEAATDPATAPETEVGDLPEWMRTEAVLEAAIDLNEHVLANTVRKPKTKLDKNGQTNESVEQEVAAALEEPVTLTQSTPFAEPTSPGFAYTEGGQYMSEFGPGEVVVGSGKSVMTANEVETVPGAPTRSVTQTAIIPRKA